MMAKEMTKICPLTYAVGKGAYDQEVASFDDCVEERCAWWHVLNPRTKRGVCYKQSLAVSLFGLATNLSRHIREGRDE